MSVLDDSNADNVSAISFDLTSISASHGKEEEEEGQHDDDDEDSRPPAAFGPVMKRRRRSPSVVRVGVAKHRATISVLERCRMSTVDCSSIVVRRSSLVDRRSSVVECRSSIVRRRSSLTVVDRRRLLESLWSSVVLSLLSLSSLSVNGVIRRTMATTNSDDSCLSR